MMVSDDYLDIELDKIEDLEITLIQLKREEKELKQIIINTKKELNIKRKKLNIHSKYCCFLKLF